MINFSREFIGTIVLTTDNQLDPRPITTYIVLPLPSQKPQSDSPLVVVNVNAFDEFYKAFSLNKSDAYCFTDENSMVESQQVWMDMIQNHGVDFMHSIIWKLIYEKK